MKLYSYSIVFLTIIFSILHNDNAQATADGPDYFKTKPSLAGTPVPIYGDKTEISPIITHIPTDTSGVRNLGCIGQPSFNAWAKMPRPGEKEKARETGWCKIQYNDTVGWVRNTHLVEAPPPEPLKITAPTFDCHQTTSHVEDVICKTPKMWILDHKLDQIYKKTIGIAFNLDENPNEIANKLKATQHGWVKGRNDCWKNNQDDLVAQCVIEAYQNRISVLQAQWRLTEHERIVAFACNDTLADEIIVTFFNQTELPTASIERGDTIRIFVQTRSASGAKYLGSFGRYFWVKGNNATLLWEQDQMVETCSESLYTPDQAPPEQHNTEQVE